MDEQPVQLIGETREPIPATKEHPERVDYEYERLGTASVFMFAEPLSGFRQATAQPRRCPDWRCEVEEKQTESRRHLPSIAKRAINKHRVPPPARLTLTPESARGSAIRI